MTSTEVKQGITAATRPSSRVLKPPGGGHTDIFAEPEVAVNAPRPKYNQQNSSNLNACMGSTDPNQKVEQLRCELSGKQADETGSNHNKNDNHGHGKTASNNITNGPTTESAIPKGRVPPGGFSSGGFW